MTPDNPMAALSILGKRLADEAAKLGLFLQQFAILPNPDPNGPHAAQAIFAIEAPEGGTPYGPVESHPETMGHSDVDAEFERMLEAQRRFEMEQKSKDARESLKELLEGFEDDDEAPF